MDRAVAAVKPQIDLLLEEKDFVLVAIDGKCTSGKTTLASKLTEIYDCNVFHMDDFFLRPNSVHDHGLQRSAAMWITRGSTKKCCLL